MGSVQLFYEVRFCPLNETSVVEKFTLRVEPRSFDILPEKTPWSPNENPIPTAVRDETHLIRLKDLWTSQIEVCVDGACSHKICLGAEKENEE